MYSELYITGDTIKGEETVWICRNCGHVFIGKEAPKTCPVCSHPQSYFEQKATNY